MPISRRHLFENMVAGAVALPFAADASAEPASRDARSLKRLRWGGGMEGQRKADLGNGYYVNPIVPGDHPDPTILKDGKDYYMTFSSFYSYPGLVIWHSRDLVNWAPVGPALRRKSRHHLGGRPGEA